MQPFHDYRLRDVLEDKRAEIRKKIDGMSNEVIMANDLEILAENIYQEFFIEPVTVFEEDFGRRRIVQKKIIKYIEPFLRDYNGHEYVELDGVATYFYYPYQGDMNLFKCRASTFSVSGYPDIDLSSESICLCVERPVAEMNSSNAGDVLLKSAAQSLETIKTGLSWANNEVAGFNNSLKDFAMPLLRKKRETVETFYNVAKMLEVPIEKKSYSETHIPLQRRIVPIAQHYETAPYYCISDNDYRDILLTLKHTVSTYERTPGSYLSLHEEDLRNTLLATLNGTYLGDATGETFRNKGKTDICIERENRAAFVAECKMWTGPKAITEAVKQLDGYLTWRDCKTALIYFVRKKNFFKILQTAEETLRSFEGMKNVSVVDKNEFDCLFLSAVNLGQQVKMRVMFFNLYFSD